MDFLDQKADFSGKKRTNLGSFFQKDPLSDQGLIKQTYLAALLGVNEVLNLDMTKDSNILKEEIRSKMEKLFLLAVQYTVDYPDLRLVFLEGPGWTAWLGTARAGRPPRPWTDSGSGTGDQPTSPWSRSNYKPTRRKRRKRFLAVRWGGRDKVCTCEARQVAGSSPTGLAGCSGRCGDGNEEENG